MAPAMDELHDGQWPVLAFLAPFAAGLSKMAPLLGIVLFVWLLKGLQWVLEAIK
jgi:hypothetical protein